LDNTLPPERVPEYEKICLESDVYLAEVASCHQILIMLLGEAAEVEPAMRRRMYRLQRATVPSVAEEPLAKEPATSTVKESVGTGKTPLESKPVSESKPEPAAVLSRPQPDDKTERVTRSRPEVPDYLRKASRPNYVPFAVTAALAFLVAIVGLRAMGQFNQHHPVLRMFRGEVEGEFAEVEHIDGSGDAKLSTTPPVESIAGQIPKKPIDDGLAPVVNPRTEPVRVPPQPAVEKPQSEPAPVPPKLPSESPAEPAAAPDKLSPELPHVEPLDDRPPANDDAPAKPARTEPAPSEPRPTAPGPKAPSQDPLPTTDVEAKVTDLGRLITEDQILVRFEPEADAWHRLSARATLRSRDRLVALPTYRPQILLASSIQVTLSGPTELTLEADGNSSSVQLHVPYGRFVTTANVGTIPATFRLRLANRTGTIRLDTADTEVAVEVRNFLPPGTNPEELPAKKVVQIYVSGGAAQWQDMGGDAVRIEPLQVCEFVDDDRVRLSAFESAPSWTNGSDISDIDRLASPELAKAIAPDRPVRLVLQENVSHRKAEVRALATRCLSFFDDFEAFFSPDGVLRDEWQRASWSVHFAALQEAIARGEASAAAVRKSLEKFRPDDAQALYRMIWGYSPAELQGGADLQLVQWLDHESMDYRVFAYANLEQMTGMTLGYLPHYPEARRKSRVAAWRARLEAGEIKYKEIPTALPKRPAGLPAP
jgi:hypothetical protein